MSSSSGSPLPTGLTLEELTYVVNHVVLPPRLPQGDDYSTRHEKALLCTVIGALASFKDHVGQEQAGVVASALVMMRGLQTATSFTGNSATIDHEGFLWAMGELGHQGAIIPLYVREQNAGIILSKVSDSVHFEMFELSPLNESVMTTKGRLVRRFPGSVVSIPLARFQDSEFLGVLADTLRKMSHSAASKTKPRVQKAGHEQDERRDTTHPKLVTELLAAVLLADGEAIQVKCIQKNTRDDVLWKASHLPWHRSAMWLLIRVSLHLHFSRHCTPASQVYKNFMLFFVANILLQSSSCHLSSDLLCTLSGKVSGRCLKLGSHANASAILRKRWSRIQDLEARPLDSGPGRETVSYPRTRVNLDRFNEYLDYLSSRKRVEVPAPFQKNNPLPDCHNSSTDFDFLSDLCTLLCRYGGTALPVEILFVEHWVATELDNWLSIHCNNDRACRWLNLLVEHYDSRSSAIYEGNPEAMSTRLLCILDLWIASEKSAIKKCPLLKDYSPIIPQDMLQSLNLSSKSHMERLRHIEDYLTQRTCQACYKWKHVFIDFRVAHSFPVRFFEQSGPHKRLRAEIERDALKFRAKKCEALRQEKEKYAKLMSQGAHQYDDPLPGIPNRKHRRDCQRCKDEREASNLEIEVDEWPLSSNEIEAKTTVFELNVPASYRAWRDMTVYVLIKVLGFKNPARTLEEFTPRYPLHSYKRLSERFRGSAGRIHLASLNKSHMVTHRASIKVSTATEANICLKNGQSYKYYDRHQFKFLEEFKATQRYADLFTYNLPGYSTSLQQFLNRYPTRPHGPDHNVVIATQSSCPRHMSTEEYKAIASIPCGYRLQWQNILRELTAPSVDFNKLETELTILQSISQAGRPSNGSMFRRGHVILGFEYFCHALLGGLTDACTRVKGTWQSVRALSTFISITSRLLALTGTVHKTVRQKSLELLSVARGIAKDWMDTLNARAQQSTDHHLGDRFRQKAVQAALVCGQSFNVDVGDLRDILSSADQASIMVECAFTIYNGLSVAQSSFGLSTQLLHYRWKVLTYLAYPVLKQEIVENNNVALDRALGRMFTSYRASGGWEALQKPYDHWLTSRTATEHQGETSRVHFSVLTGELVMNGGQLTKLPNEYEQDAMYATLFGGSRLEVAPDTSASVMRFSGKQEFAGHNVRFGMSNAGRKISEGDLLVQATMHGKTFESVPPHLLRGAFPPDLVDNFVHWYNHEEKHLEFRPKEDPWTHSDKNWTLYSIDNSARWLLKKEETCLVNVRRKLAAALTKILSPLAEPSSVHIIHDRSRLCHEIELTRVQLGFSLDLRDKSIKSLQYRGFSIDVEDQSIGTLVGLQNKLVLKSDRDPSCKKVIIPDGKISAVRTQGHVQVYINKSSATTVHVYDVDTLLGRLVDNGSLRSKLLLCYLHALTSFCLPDPLTNKTGTEMALALLRSAAIRSFTPLTTEHVELLLKISQLTPSREFYPSNEKVMQKVTWSSDLGFLAQHGGFQEAVDSIFANEKRLSVFSSESDTELPDLDASRHLLHRDNIRTAAFRISGFGAEKHTPRHDVIYSSRDRMWDSIQGARAFQVSSILLGEQLSILCELPENLDKYLWNFLKGQTHIVEFQPESPLPSKWFRFDPELLDTSKENIAKTWIQIFDVLRSKESRPDKFQFMMWLATAAFSEHADLLVLRILAYFYRLGDVTTLASPPATQYHLKEGLCPSVDRLVAKFNPILRPKPNPNPKTRSTHHFRPEEGESFEGRRKKTVTALAANLIGQLSDGGLSRSIRIPDAESYEWNDYIQIKEAIGLATDYLTSLHMNTQLFRFLGQISNRLPRGSPKLSMPASVDGLLLSNKSPRSPRYISDIGILDCSPPNLDSHTYGTQQGPSMPLGTKNATRMSGLGTLTVRLDTIAKSHFESRYMTHLKRSLDALQRWETEPHIELSEEELKNWLIQHQANCELSVKEVYGAMVEAVMKGLKVKGELFAKAEGLSHLPQNLPRLSPSFFLQRLARHGWHEISSGWRDSIVRYGVAVTRLQQADRMMYANRSALVKEMQDPGHTSWNPRDHPEYLLLELESNIMIREVQEQIAAQMISPPSPRNAVMQLNMGEGKSSVILPMAAAALADRTQLVRVIVGKAQSHQAREMLVSKLGGMLDRQVYQLPFTRSLKHHVDPSVIQEVLDECKATGGILLVQPEHILSLKLMGIECATSVVSSIAAPLLATQKFLTEHSRDIVDESDENFSVRFELVYTMGSQRAIEHSPERWTCAQEVLGFFRRAAIEVHAETPHAMEIQTRTGRFPRIRIFRQEAQDQIRSRVAHCICEEGLKGFPITMQTPRTRRAVERYISEFNPCQTDIDVVEDAGSQGFWTKHKRTLLVLRGLLAAGVLAFCFGQKRWRVDYGLDPTRKPPTRLALPFRAKDKPAPHSEFSHPDVVIVLTSLSRLAFTHLLKSDQPDSEYSLWVKDTASLPAELRQPTGINLEDRQRCEKEIFPSFRFTKSVIDYFLSQIVFPREVKEYTHKLKPHPTTGFSGTNDSGMLLPLDVDQLDLEEQQHTNALIMPPQREIRHTMASTLLDLVTGMERPTRVILDVGAQILELDNLGVAREWLQRMPDPERTQAFLDRKGRIEPLQVSPFTTQMDLYLKLPKDYRAAITLGAKLTKDRLVQACMRMRQLGKGQSVVFCVPEEIQIRIRDQVFAAETSQDEEDISVADILAWAVTETWQDLKRSMPLWAVQGRRHEHHREIWARQQQPPLLDQKAAREFLEEEAQSLERRYRPRASQQREDESDTEEEEMYRHRHHDGSSSLGAITERCREFGLVDRGATAALEEEQERELAPEAEQERERVQERPASASACAHTLHADVVAFVRTGEPVAGSAAYMPAFQSLSRTTAADELGEVARQRLFSSGPQSQQLLVTADFARTVATSDPSGLAPDAYQRSVHWVLSSTGGQKNKETKADDDDHDRNRNRNRNQSGDEVQVQVKHLMVISPHEANQLLIVMIMKQSPYVRLHMYAARTRQSHPALDGLDLFTFPAARMPLRLPRRLVVQLNLFAGQLYLGSYAEYVEVCKALGLAWAAPRDDDDDVGGGGGGPDGGDEGTGAVAVAGEGEGGGGGRVVLAADGFILDDGRGRAGGESGLSESPVGFFQTLLTKVRGGSGGGGGFEKTHMGRLLDGQLLTPADFEE
ncbi:hypothetical protein GGR56DRAFT_688190 [Xylariaceae sp. FL0804]|nr:hypothetical protein GGR56DRAFT_688190 [Xylariaceae sp. FL0804]